MTADCDVLIAGAGPTGMSAALALVDLGHSVCIIDKHAKGLGYSRAILVNPATLERLHPHGVAEPIIARGWKIGSLAVRSARKVLVHGQIVGNLTGNFPPVALPQLETEDCLKEALGQRGTTIVRSCALESFVQDASGVTCTLHGGDGTHTMRARYLIGADGYHSTVRNGLGVKFPETANPTRMYSADAVMTWPFEEDLVVWLTDMGGAIAIDLGNRLVRFAATHKSVFNALECTSAIERTTWESEFDVTFGQAERYGIGRVWLAGDAAHVHSPVGGRGMNMGIADGLRLGRALHEGNPATYEAERRRVAADWISQNRRLTRIASRQGFVGRTARSLACNALTAFAQVSGEKTAISSLFRRMALGPT